MNISSGPSTIVDLRCVGDSKLCELGGDANVRFVSPNLHRD